MAVLEVEPNVTLEVGDWTKVGAATDMHVIVSDDDDATYLVGPPVGTFPDGGDAFRLTFPIPSVPAGAKIVAVRQRVRIRASADLTGGSTYVTAQTYWGTPQVGTGLPDDYHADRFDEDEAAFTERYGAWRTSPPDTSGGEWTPEDLGELVLIVDHDTSTFPTLGEEPEIAEVSLEVDYNERPAATALSPSGTVSTTSAPEASWTYTDAESDPQEAYEVVVIEGDETGLTEPSSTAASATVLSTGKVYSSATSVQLPSMASDTYTLWVRVWQTWDGVGTAEHRSAWASVAFTISVTPPPVPDVTLTAEPDDLRVRVDLSDPDGVGGASEDTETFDVQYSDDYDAGDPTAATWAYVRGGVDAAADGSLDATVYDVEPAGDTARFYRARATRLDPGTSEPYTSAWSTPTSVTLPVSRWWLLDPLDPAGRVALRAEWSATVTSEESVGVFDLLGRADPLVVSDVIRSDVVDLVVSFRTRAEWVAFDTLRRARTTLYLVSPNGEYWHVRFPAGLTSAMPAAVVGAQWRTVPLTLRAVARPAVT